MTSQHEIALLRLVAQRVAGGALPDPTGVVRWLTAVQAQDLPGARVSVALRTSSGDVAAVTAALDAGEIVRSWPMRGTLHLVAAEDLSWLRELLTPRRLAAEAGRRAQLGLDEAALTRAGELAAAMLAGGRRLRRAELLAGWQEAGVDTGGQRGYHLLAHLAQAGLLCLGPTAAGPAAADGEQAFVLAEEWIRAPRRLPREEALGELAARYFRSHGPATVKDLARWGYLTMADARAGAAQARESLATLTVDGIEYLLDPELPERLASSRRQARGVFLLPGFDELVLGYADRSATLAPAYADRIVPGGNGVFQPTIVSDGRIVGTWRRGGRSAAAVPSASPFEPLPPPVAKAVDRALAALAAAR